MSDRWLHGVLRGGAMDASGGPLVVKVGGSLLARPRWGESIAELLAFLPRRCTVVVGGGPVVDGLRVIDAAVPQSAEAMPKAALAWFVVAFTTVAIPGSLAFVAEDLVLHGLLAAHPVLAVLMLLASILDAVTVMRAGASLFLGPPADVHTVSDLLVRERIALAVAFSLLVGAGLAPSPAVDFARRALHGGAPHAHAE